MSEESNTLLTRLKIDIGIMNDTTFDQRLGNLLEVSKSEVSKFIGEEVDTTDIRDAELVIDYARWQWLSRREPAAMPVSLKYRLNCRAFERNVPDGSDES